MYTDLIFVVVCSYIHDYTVESQKNGHMQLCVTGRSITNNALYYTHNALAEAI